VPTVSSGLEKNLTGVQLKSRRKAKTEIDLIIAFLMIKSGLRLIRIKLSKKSVKGELHFYNIYCPVHESKLYIKRHVSYGKVIFVSYSDSCCKVILWGTRIYLMMKIKTVFSVNMILW
jgi:hypothetical protein